MNIVKKILNVFGILLAWILSLVLIPMLMVSPLLFSGISFVQPDNMVEMVTDVDISQLIPDFEAVGGGDLTETEVEQIEKILNTDAVKEFITVYTKDVTNSLFGIEATPGFTPELFMEIVDDNIDELIEVFKAVDPELSDVPVEELETEVREFISENTAEMLESLPAPETVREQLVENNPEMETALKIWGQMDMIKWVIVGVTVILAVLIFLCRLFGFRGFRWLAVDLFIASAFSGLLCAPLIATPDLLTGLLEGNEGLAGILGTAISGFAEGMVIRTAIMFVSGIALLTVYLLIKSARKKKQAAALAAQVVVENTPDLADN